MFRLSNFELRNFEFNLCYQVIGLLFMDLNINLLLERVKENCYQNEKPCECNLKERAVIDENLCSQASSHKHIKIDGDEENCRRCSYYCCYQNVVHCSEPTTIPSKDKRKDHNDYSFDQRPYENLTLKRGKLRNITSRL